MIKLSPQLIKAPLALSVAAVISSMTPTVASAGAKLEEIIVTATKTDEMMSDIPISLSVVTGEDVEKYNIQRFEDISPYVPNFQLNKGGINNVINIRGIASGNQAGFEQSVGTFIDGVFRGRGVQSRFAFLDIGAIEVLRGPQGTLFGKNTVAGALNIKSAKPTEELTASVKAAYNIDHEETEVTGVVSGAISETVRGRLAIMAREMDDGWVENTATDEGAPQNDEWAARGTLEWDVSDETVATLKYEHGDWDNRNSAADIVVAGNLAALGYTNGRDGKSQISQAGDPVLETGSDRLFEGNLDEVSLNIEHYTDHFTYTAILGYSEYEYERRSDVDYTTLGFTAFNDNEEQEQGSLELRVASDLDGELQFIAGAYYQQANLTSDGLSQINLPTAYTLINGGCLNPALPVPGTKVVTGPGDIPGSIAATVGSNFGAGTTAATANLCAQAAALDSVGGAAAASGIARYALLDQESETWAAFTQFTWTATDDIRAILGLRYSEEEKTATQRVGAVDYAKDNRTVAATGLQAALSATFLEFTTHTLDDDVLERDEESFTWSLSGQWDATPDAMLYTTASTGFKSGGFNSFYMGQAAEAGYDTTGNDAQFDEEEALTFEVGAKISLLDGAAELNVAVFRTEYDDLQVSVFSGNTTFDVRNAAEAVTQGIEIDGRWQASEELLLSGSLGWIDFEFDNFSNQACTNSQFQTYREDIWNDTSLTVPQRAGAAGLNAADCAAAGINDLSGKTSAHTPELIASFMAEYNQNLGAFNLTYSVDVHYQDEIYRQDDLDENLLADAVTKVNASIRLSPTDEMWEVALFGKNITDEDDDFTWGNDVPLLAGSFAAEAQPGANYTITATLRY